jgi:predicted nuclease with TOPRIM domain
MEKSKINMIKIGSWAILVLTILTAIAITVKTCNRPPVSPMKSRLEELNDSLLQEMKSNHRLIDSLHHKLDSLNTLTDTLIQIQPIVNEYYTQEVYTILSDDAKRSNRRLSETLKASDSLLKSGFYTRVIDFSDPVN